MCALALAACGGGGGGGGESNNTFPPASTDTYPSGTRVDVASLDILPFHAGDTWVYARSSNGIPDGTQVTRTVTTGPDAAGAFSITENGPTSSEVLSYRISAAGLEELDPLGMQGFLPAVFSAFPSWIAYPTPLYAAGETRRHVRQGSLGEDLDGDRKADSFRVELTQVFVGFENQTVFGQTTQVAHFRTTLEFTVRITSTGEQSTGTALEDSWLAPGIGLVRTDRSATADGAVVVAPFTLQLQSATIAGVTRMASGATIRYALGHRSITYDATRRVYYVAVSAGDALHPSSIATISADAGAISYSGPVGFSPSALAVSADGTTLYAALDAGDVIRLSLPSMTETGRVRLPVHPFFGQERAEDIALSATSNNVVAVSLYYSNISPRHAGVVLLRDMVIQPQRTPGHTGSNRVEFDPSGNWVFGYNNETTEFGLRRLEVLADGLAQREVVIANVNFYEELSVADGLAVVSNRVFRADGTLAFLGEVPNATDCFKLPMRTKLACRSTGDPNQILVADSSTFTSLGMRTFGLGMGTRPFQIVPGPAGQILIGEEPLGAITLFRDPLLE